jgi:hypothetical protein
LAGQFGFSADLHPVDAFGPALDHTVHPDFKGFVPPVVSAEFIAIGHQSQIMVLGAVRCLGASVRAISERANYQTSGGYDRIGFLRGRGRQVRILGARRGPKQACECKNGPHSVDS